MIRKLTQYLILIVLCAPICVFASSPGGIPKQLSFSSLPRKLVEIKKRGSEFVIHKGKCCLRERIFSLSKLSNQWVISMQQGFEDVLSQVLKYESTGNSVTIVAKWDRCDNCPEKTFKIFAELDRPYFYRMIGDPINGGSSEIYWVDDNYRSKVRTETTDDCPKGGEAC